MTVATVWQAVRARSAGPAAGLRHTRTLAWRGLLQIRHHPAELLDLSIQPVMFVLLFTYVFGGAISGSPHDYLTFLLPGIIVQNALFTAMTTGVGLNVDLTKGVYDRLRSLPIAPWSPLAGRILADVVKQAWSFALLLTVGAILGFRISGGGLGLIGAFALLLVFVLAASSFSVLVGVLVSEPEKVQVFGFTAIFPLTLTSSIFVPARTMPSWLQGWVTVNPATVLADALRGLLTGGPVAGPAARSLLWGAAIALVCAPLALVTLRRRG